MQLDAYTGDYVDKRGLLALTLFRQGDQLYQKNRYGEIAELDAESVSVLFYPNGSSIARIIADRDSQGRVSAITLRDDRHEERWERTRPAVRTHPE